MKRSLVSSLAAVFLLAGFFCSGAPAANAAVATNESADNVIGQQNMTSSSLNQGAGVGNVDGTKLYMPRNPFFDGSKFFVVDRGNNRVLIYNSIPTSDNASADVVIGQASLASGGSANQGGSVDLNKLNQPASVFSDGTKLIITDSYNNRVLIYNSIPTTNNANADVVIGQQNMTSDSANQGGAVGANTLNNPSGIFYTGKQLLISDYDNNRVLIYNSLPTANDANADIVIGQQNMTSNSANQGGAVSASTLDAPIGIFFNGKKLFIADEFNNCVLVYNSIPTANNASADVIIGQPNATSNSTNQGGAASASTLYYPTNVFSYGPKLLVADILNDRVLIYNSIPTANNASADVVIGQQNMTSDSANQGGAVGANTIYNPRGAIVADQKLIVGDLQNNRVLIYNSFGSAYVITKNHSKTLSGDEKIKVKKKKIEFSGKKTAYKKGRVKIYRDGSLVKNVKIKKSGKWKAGFKDTGSAVKDFVLKYYDSTGVLQMNSETYALGIDRGSLVEATLEKATFDGSVSEKPKKTNTSQPAKEAPKADATSQ